MDSTKTLLGPVPPAYDGLCGEASPLPFSAASAAVAAVLGVTPTGPGAAPVGLPSPMFPAGAPRGGGVSVSRFVPAPRGVCSHGFQSRLLRKHSLVGLLACGERSHRGTSLILRIVMTRAGHSATVELGSE